MPEFWACNWNQLTLFNSAIMKYAKTLGPFSKWDKFSGFQQNSWINCKGVVLYGFMMWNPAQFHRLTGSWCTPRKHGTSHTAFFDIYTIEMSLVVKNDSSVHFDFFFLWACHLHVISDWFSDIFPPKIQHFFSPSDSKLQETNFKRLISQNHFF